MDKDTIAVQKRLYIAPALRSIRMAPMQMLAASGDPEVHTTSDKASTDYDALGKGSRYDVWDDDWSK